MAVCFCVDLSVRVSLQEAELAARILLDRGQVTAGGSSRVGGKKGPPTWLSSLLPFLPIHSLPIPNSPLPPLMLPSQCSLMLSNHSLFFSTLKIIPTVIFTYIKFLSTLFPIVCSLHLSLPLPHANSPAFVEVSCLFSSQPNSYLMVICFLADSLGGDTLWLCHFYCLWYPQTQTPSDTHLP